MAEIYFSNALFGCIPNCETPDVMARISDLATPWDGKDIEETPDVITYESFEKALETMPDVDSRWWEKYNWEDYVITSQSYRPNCAGCAEATATVTRTLIQAGSQYSEQLPKKFNPMMTWLLSKGGSAIGGQSIGAMAQAGNEIGNFLAEDVGEYDPANISLKRSEKANLNAKERQICYCIYDGNDPAEAVLKALQKGFTCFVGNNRAIADGRYTDENGVECVKLSRNSWSHATAYAGFQIVNGKRYAYWINSHGKIYQANDGTPPIGGWQPEETVRDFLGGSFHDVCFIVYAEAPYNPNATKTLNPMVKC